MASSRASSGTIRRNFGDGSILNANAAFGLYHFDARRDLAALRPRPARPRPQLPRAASANIITSSAAITNSASAAAG